jgi:hypothetical protein
MTCRERSNQQDESKIRPVEMTRPRARSGLLCSRGRRLFYKPVGEVGRSCLCVGWLLLPRLFGQKPSLHRTGVPIRQIPAFSEATLSLRRRDRGGHLRCRMGRTYDSRRQIGCNTPRRCIRCGTGCRHDIAFPLESALGGRSTPNKLRETRATGGFCGNRTVAGRLTARGWESQSCTASRPNCRLRRIAATAQSAPRLVRRRAIGLMRRPGLDSTEAGWERTRAASYRARRKKKNGAPFGGAPLFPLPFRCG